MLVLLMLRHWWRFVGIVMVLVLPVVVYHLVPSVAQRIDTAVSEVDTYFEELHEGKHYIGGTVIRFEMWRSAWIVFEDSPILGIGRGNYPEVMRQYVEAGKVPAAVSYHGHAHNAYVGVLLSRGITGFVIFLGMLFYPLYYFVKTRHLSPDTAVFGIMQVIGFAVFSMTDASTFIMGNFTSIFLLCMSVFLSWHVTCVNQSESRREV